MNWGKIIIGDSRNMSEIDNETIDLIITSPPYWHLKDYGVANQIGYGQTLHEYLKDLYRVWQECFRVLKEGRRLCINIGDQFARSIVYGRYKIIPLHSEIIAQCEDIGFDYMGAIIWQKKTTMNTSGGANVMGSYPYPPNGMIEIDYEFILIFKKHGKSPKVSPEIKEKSVLTKEEWKEYFSGHWYFKGEKQTEHEAMFPDELPYRLIKMFSFVGDTVLDPFLGSGTTLKVALELERNGIGYEINPDFLEVINKKLNTINNSFLYKIETIKKETETPEIKAVKYEPRIKDASPIIDPKIIEPKKNQYFKVSEIVSADTVKLNSGLEVKLLGVKIKKEKEKEAVEYLKNYVLNKEVFLRYDSNSTVKNNNVNAYLYLKNKIFINAYLIKSGLALADKDSFYTYKNKFKKLEMVD
ncbi:DNA methylase N-4/N-6 domain protein [Caldicellulosiruptor kronotskyensis 2002]|uniref:Methyltransferase n=1 Tax=Caldicellulosiruptor kronotskyensis (strain DSM 18902 / VKM B-2412 / 2002) TaxID=632348 RepID=E4SHK5_CALK2|nr:DNA methyltransferase [Caldicellulosiruptor kronotskyensis]ADQ47230.1 DNA methylase N-4/N-6 domain protein [Caldicellulosiruptor kronotskyensis 2002]